MIENDDPREFGCGIEPNPKARYWQKRAEFWREQAIAHGYDPEALAEVREKIYRVTGLE